jgi:cobalamin biosynthesis Mg chelatase CobN
MLNPQAAAPVPRPAAKAADAVPEITEEVTTPEAPGGTQILVPGRQPEPRPARPPDAPGPKPSRQQASTNIMTVEESEEAQRVAQAKLEQASKGLVRTRTRADKRAEMRQARASRGMWIALGVGTLAAVALIVGLLFLFFSDDSVSPVGRRSRRLDTPETRATPADPGDRSGTTRR